MNEFFEKLFDYVFPVDFRMQQRDKFDECRQDFRTVLDFLRKLQEIADTIGDMTDRDIVLAFWRRSQSYLRVEMTKEHLDPTVMSLSMMEEAAVRHERAHKLADLEGKRGSAPTRQPSNNFASSTKHENKSASSNSSSNDNKRQDKGKGKESSPPEKRTSQFSKAERGRRNRLRSEGKCFTCEGTGHLEKDCPKRTSLKPPTASSSNIRLHNAEFESVAEVRLAALEEGSRMGLYSTMICDQDPELGNEIIYYCAGMKGPRNPEREERIRRLQKSILSSLYSAVPLTFDYVLPDAESCPFQKDRFGLSVMGNGDSECCGSNCIDCDTFELQDSHSYESHLLRFKDVDDPNFDIVHWLHLRKSESWDLMVREKRQRKWCDCFTDLSDSDDDSDSQNDSPSSMPDNDRQSGGDLDQEGHPPSILISAAITAASGNSGKGHKSETRLSLERNSARVKSSGREVPKPLVVVINISGKPCRALLDTGSQSDFMSTTLVDQLKLPYTVLEKVLPLQLAVSGSRSAIKCTVTASFAYQGIKSERLFDVANLDSYDVILGLPFLVQHSMVIGLNPAQVTVRSVEPLPYEPDQVFTIASRAAEIQAMDIDRMHEELVEYASDICKEATETPLPPLRVINHVIPLIDETKPYNWHPSKCPEPLKPLWRSKRDDYIKTGRWEFRSGTNSVPMIMLKKATKDGSLRLRTVLDTRQRNDNTKKLASPLPDIETILRNVASHPYRSLLDGKDAYEQIRVEPSHVPRTLFTTPDGTMISHVMQIGDTNAGATYQTLMNHIFAPFLGVFMDVYLDDIIIYSDTAEDHVKHVKQVIDTLRENQFYLSAHKLQFFRSELIILGHVVDSKGIRMDPSKVDSIVNWKVPTNKGLLASFNGAVSYLAPGCEGIRIPMSILAKRAAPLTPWQWESTEQRAFEQVQDCVAKWRDVRRVPLDYVAGREEINLTCDASLTGASGVISQGDDLDKANVVAFWSGKFNPAQQNYPVHELELLAIVESSKRFRHLLHGIKFRVFTDHKGLEWITSQKKLSPRQARWLEVLGDFDFKVSYLPGSSNILADALSRMYSNEPLGVVRAASEYVSAEEENAPSKILLSLVTAPLYTGEFIYLGASKSRKRGSYATTARKAFPNAKKVVLRVRAPIVPPEGGSGSPVQAQVVEPPAPGNSIHESVDYKSSFDDIYADDNGDTMEDQRPSHLEAHEHASEETPLEPARTYAKDVSVAEEILSEEPPSLTEVISLGDPSVDIHRSLRNRYSEDTFFSKILSNPQAYKNFEVQDGLMFMKHVGRRILCVPDILVGKRRVREMIISHAHSILAHLGALKTIIYLRDNVWWKGMISDVEDFCRTCVICKTSKPSNQPPYGTLETLEVPTRPWETIGIDFVGPLPESENLNGLFDMLLVVIDHLTSMVHLIPSKQTYRAKDVAEILFDRVYKHHGMPSHIVSDRDSLFTSTFWRTLHELTRVELRMSSSFHPQSDGATERANRTVTQMLRQCIAPHQRDWVSRLPAIEFAINSARSASTGYSPFVLNYGRMPPSMIFETNSEYPGVRRFAEGIKSAIMSAHDSIIAARVKQTEFANRKRKDTPFVKGDLVFLSTANISLPKGRARKLAPKFIGPFKILEDYKNNSYLLDLPSELKQRGLHPAFHASLLRISEPNDDRRFPGRQMPQMIGIGKVEDWSIGSIGDHQGKGRDSLFEVVYKAGDRVWLPYHEVSKLEALNQYFEALGIVKIGDLPKKISPINPSISLFGVATAGSRDPISFIDKMIEELPEFHHRMVSKGSSMVDKECRRARYHPHPPTCSMADAQLTEIERQRYKDFGALVASGREIPESCFVPLGYVAYCIQYQHDEDPSKRLPLPLGTPVQTILVNGRETLALVPDQVAPVVNVAPAAAGWYSASGPGSYGAPAPQSDVGDDHVPWASSHGSNRGRGNGRGNGRGRGPRNRPRKPRMADMLSSMLGRFDLDTALQVDEMKATRRKPRAPSPGLQHEYAPRSYPAPRHRNKSVDFRSHSVGHGTWVPSHQSSGHDLALNAVASSSRTGSSATPHNEPSVLLATTSRAGPSLGITNMSDTLVDNSDVTMSTTLLLIFLWSFEMLTCWVIAFVEGGSSSSQSAVSTASISSAASVEETGRANEAS